MKQSTNVFTQTLPSSRRIITPIRLINTISRREILTDTECRCRSILYQSSYNQQQKLPARSSDGFVYGVKRRKGKRAALPTIAMPGNCGQTTIVEAFESDQLPNDVEVVIGMESFRKATSRLL